MTKRRHIETDHQRALFAWAKLAEARIPALRWLFHVPNGERRDRRTAALLKAMGVKRGVPDAWLPVGRGTFVGLVIEMKAPGARPPSGEQEEWLNFLSMQGWSVKTCYGWEEARAEVCSYLRVQP